MRGHREPVPMDSVALPLSVVWDSLQVSARSVASAVHQVLKQFLLEFTDNGLCATTGLAGAALAAVDPDVLGQNGVVLVLQLLAHCLQLLQQVLYHLNHQYCEGSNDRFTEKSHERHHFSKLAEGFELRTVFLLRVCIATHRT